jgi:multicomponent K+:H+ antiporter subunit E
MSALGRVGFWTVLLTVSWCLLLERPGIGSLLLGVLLAFGIACWLVRDDDGRRLRPGVLVRLAVRVAWDIVASNLVVARQVLFHANRLQPAWIELPLRLSDDARVVALAAIISLTPGTISVDLVEADGRRRLRVHALDAPDPEAVAAEIRDRYETLLLELLR